MLPGTDKCSVPKGKLPTTEFRDFGRTDRLIVSGNPVSRGVCAVSLIAALSMATAGCDRGSRRDGASSPGNVAEEEKTIVPHGGGNTTIADDPTFRGNEVIVQEYGDEESRPTASPGGVADAAAASKKLTGAAIRHAISGHELTDGVHWSWKFKPGGRLLSEENGRRTTGRWPIQLDELCIDAGFGDRCHTVTRQGRSFQLWHEGVVAVEAELDR